MIPEGRTIEEHEDINNITKIVCSIIPNYVTNNKSKHNIRSNSKNIVCQAKQLYKLIITNNLKDVEDN